ncbi:MAG TPA: hypothetical protein VMU07_00135 [Candidatus Paceibacterota bacterium]|nr:hypothetical protein [Candidatus Paceibacterota bacterium]
MVVDVETKEKPEEAEYSASGSFLHGGGQAKLQLHGVAACAARYEEHHRSDPIQECVHGVHVKEFVGDCLRNQSDESYTFACHLSAVPPFEPLLGFEAMEKYKLVVGFSSPTIAVRCPSQLAAMVPARQAP